MKKVATSFRLTEECIRLIGELAEASGVSKTDAVELAVRQVSRGIPTRAVWEKLQKRKALPKRNPKRKASEFARCYHSKERVAFVKTLPCSVPGCANRRIENVHAIGGGMGRKANYDRILPLCKAHHAELHKTGSSTFQRKYNRDLLAEAIRTDELWQEHHQSGGLI